MSDSGLLRPKEAAALLYVSQQTMARWRQTGDGPPWLKLGPKTYRYPKGALLEFMRSRDSRQAT